MMTRQLTLKRGFARTIEAFKRHPYVVQYESVTNLYVHDGTTCHIKHGEWKFTVDAGKHQGVNNKEPGPGILKRAAPGSCLATGSSSWAAYFNIPVGKIKIILKNVIDALPMYGPVKKTRRFQ